MGEMTASLPPSPLPPPPPPLSLTVLGGDGSDRGILRVRLSGSDMGIYILYILATLIPQGIIL